MEKQNSYLEDIAGYIGNNYKAIGKKALIYALTAIAFLGAVGLSGCYDSLKSSSKPENTHKTKGDLNKFMNCIEKIKKAHESDPRKNSDKSYMKEMNKELADCMGEPKESYFPNSNESNQEEIKRHNQEILEHSLNHK